MRQQIPLPDLRKRRADMLTAMVMNLIERFLRNDDEVDARGYAARALREFFFTVGVEVITDFERTMAGLPLRDNEGYTEDQLNRLMTMMERATMDIKL